ncbi:MAG: protein translocase subunit SecF [Candidatus Chisholmbacteria bacterium]|nr:protein translocase subunit SecF [Candidatus Chisholmbacteria bacterium]
MREKMGEVEERRFETVGPTIGKELLIKTVTAVIVAAGAILVYVAYRFKSFKFGVCAVVAMVHDTIVVVGSFSLLGKLAGVEVDTLFVTAVLTILSFSVHDTIVVYDRIRESVKLYPKADFEAVVDYAVTTTLSRSINNSMTIIFTLLALFLLGGETIRWFILALLIGTVSGTYSSTFTAAPLLVVWEKVASKRLKQR